MGRPKGRHVAWTIVLPVSMAAAASSAIAQTADGERELLIKQLESIPALPFQVAGVVLTLIGAVAAWWVWRSNTHPHLGMRGRMETVWPGIGEDCVPRGDYEASQALKEWIALFAVAVVVIILGLVVHAAAFVEVDASLRRKEVTLVENGKSVPKMVSEKIPLPSWLIAAAATYAKREPSPEKKPPDRWAEAANRIAQAAEIWAGKRPVDGSPCVGSSSPPVVSSAGNGDAKVPCPPQELLQALQNRLQAIEQAIKNNHQSMTTELTGIRDSIGIVQRKLVEQASAIKGIDAAQGALEADHQRLAKQLDDIRRKVDALLLREGPQPPHPPPVIPRQPIGPTTRSDSECVLGTSFKLPDELEGNDLRLVGQYFPSGNIRDRFDDWRKRERFDRTVKAKSWRTVNWRYVHFESNVWELSPGASADLNKFLEQVLTKDSVLQVWGLADTPASPEYNVALSNARSMAVTLAAVRAFSSLPIVDVRRMAADGGRSVPIVDVQGLGETRPLASDSKKSDPYGRVVRVAIMQPCVSGGG